MIKGTRVCRGAAVLCIPELQHDHELLAARLRESKLCEHSLHVPCCQELVIVLEFRYT